MDWSRTPDFDLELFSHFKLFSSYSQDLVTWLTSTVSLVWLIACAAYLLFISLFEPIMCLCPAEFTDAMCNYTNSYCWTGLMYVFDNDKEIPRDKVARHTTADHKVSYYPLIPFILMAVALALNLPAFIWKACNGEQGLDIDQAVELGRNPARTMQAGKAVAFEITFPSKKSKFSHSKRRKLRAMLPSKMESVEKFVAGLGVFPLGSGLGAYQTGLFLFTRLLAVALCIAIFFWLNFALDTDYVAWGWGHVLWAATGEELPWLEDIFPDVTICDFRIPQLSNLQMWTVKCVLHININSEKVFIFLWFWLLLLIAVNVYSYQYWFRKIMFSSSRRNLVSKHMRRITSEHGKIRQSELTPFALHFLTHDSVLMLKILEICVGNQFVDQVVENLWKEFKEELEKELKMASHEDSDPPPDSSQPVGEAEASL